MRLLVVGGTYFLGKAFMELCDNGENEVILLNRGNRTLSLKYTDKIKHIQMERHDPEQLQKLGELLKEAPVDAVVDFCAYEAGDIRSIMEILPKGTKQYLFISTCDVYRRGSGEGLDEKAKLEERSFPGQEGAYICGKVALEKELPECSARYGIAYTVLRPTIIYGPDNYAPREGIYFHWITKAGQILYPENAGGTFQMVYVRDVAKYIFACLCREECYGQAYNICGDGVLDYKSFTDCLEKACSQRIERVSVTVEDVLERGIPLPFPLTRAESEYYLGEKSKALGVGFTPLEDGLKETFLWFCERMVTGV